MIKKYIFAAIIIATILLFPFTTFAAGKASISGPSSVESGSNVTVTVTLSNVAAWNISITGTGATGGVTKKFADATGDAMNTTKTFSVTCKSSGAGTITFTVTGDVTSEDGTNSGVSVTKNISVIEKTTKVDPPAEKPSTEKPSTEKPSTPKPSTEQPSSEKNNSASTPNVSNNSELTNNENKNNINKKEESAKEATQDKKTNSENIVANEKEEKQEEKKDETQEKDSECRLESLSIQGYTLTPDFDKDVEEYFVQIPITENKITIEAKAISSKAQVNGAQEYDVKEGENEFYIEVIAENGNTKKYKIKVEVLDLNPIKVTINGIEYTILKQKELLPKIDDFTDATIKINDIEVPVLTNEITELMIIGLKDQNGNISYYKCGIQDLNFEYSEEKSNIKAKNTGYIIAIVILVLLQIISAIIIYIQKRKK